MVRLTAPEFMVLMEQLAQAWSQQDTAAALACFADDATYMEPPDVQLYQTHAQLRPYFAALTPGTFMHFHNLWFDEAQQIGAGEFSFGVAGSSSADHGIVVVELHEGKIAFWREYLRKGPPLFADFLRIDGKQWQWHIGNYP